MGDHKGGTAGHQDVHTVLHQLFGAGIDGTCRFIQNQNRWIGDGSSCDGKQLALAFHPELDVAKSTAIHEYFVSLCAAK